MTVTAEPLDTGLACLRALVEGPLVEDREFPTAMGLSRSEARAILSLDRDTILNEHLSAVSNVVVNLLGYPHVQDDLIEAMTGVPRDALKDTVDQLRVTRERATR